jgi:hypothetical protein
MTGSSPLMISQEWRVRSVRAELPEPRSPLPFVDDLLEEWREWLTASGQEGMPFLMSPLFE